MSLIIAYLGIMSVLIIALNARYFGEVLGVMDCQRRSKIVSSAGVKIHHCGFGYRCGADLEAGLSRNC